MSEIKIRPQDFNLDESMCKKVQGFINWVKDYSVVFKDSEVIVHDDFCSGRYDILCDINGQLYIVDIKTGGLYDEHCIQTSFYSKAYTPDQPGTARPALLQLKDNTKSGYLFKEVEYEKWIKVYEYVCQLYQMLGFPMEPKNEVTIPKVLKLEV